MRGAPALDERARLRDSRAAAPAGRRRSRAEAAGDGERAAIAREQRQALAEVVARDFGLGGRVRRVGDPVERARKTVSTRIRRTIAMIGRAHPELGSSPRTIDRYRQLVRLPPTRADQLADLTRRDATSHVAPSPMTVARRALQRSWRRPDVAGREPASREFIERVRRMTSVPRCTHRPSSSATSSGCTGRWRSSARPMPPRSRRGLGWTSASFRSGSTRSTSPGTASTARRPPRTG